MTYDLTELARTVARKRKALLRRIAPVAFLMLTAAVIALLRFSAGISLLCFTVELPLFYLLTKIYRNHDGKTLFSREIVGENVKESEYSIFRDSTPNIRRVVWTPNTYANRKEPPLALNGSVYLKMSDGNIARITGLYHSHMEIYEEGDVLQKPAGARFPIVISRNVARQPCPCCGEVNTEGDPACRACGLKILPEIG